MMRLYVSKGLPLLSHAAGASSVRAPKGPSCQLSNLRFFSAPRATSRSAEYTISNSYNLIPQEEAAYDRSRSRKKIHDWTLSVDVHDNPNLIQSVRFGLGNSYKPSSFVCSSPIQVRKQDGSVAWRFSTRQQSFGRNKGPKATVSLLGTGGTKWEDKYQVKHANASGTKRVFSENSKIQPLQKVKIPEGQYFGIELELTSPNRGLDVIANMMTQRTGGRFGRVTVIRNHLESRSPSDVWRMVPDSSISSLDGESFEIVSPILSGEDGLRQVKTIVTKMKDGGARKGDPEIEVNRSMGYHVHVDVSSLSLASLKKVCQNFVKYETVMDKFLPPSRRTGSGESNRYFKSNRDAIKQSAGNYPATGKGVHGAIAACTTLAELARLMNPDNSRYYKLNLQNLASGRQTTMEFRQHSATSNGEKIENWVRFCIAMVNNSARLKTPRPFRAERTMDFRFDGLFEYVIKDRALRSYYEKRRREFI